MANWKSTSNALGAFGQMFDLQMDCNVHFLVDGKTIGAHKSFLRARSEVMGKLINECEDGNIVIKTINFPIMEKVLR